MLRGRVRLVYFVYAAVVWFLFCFFSVTAQSPPLDSLRNLLRTEKSDTGKAALFIALVNDEGFNDPDSMLILCKKALTIVEKKNNDLSDAERNSFIRTKANAYHLIAYALQEKNQLKEAKEFLDLALVYATDPGLKADIYNSLGDLQKDNDPRKALEYYKISLKFAEKGKDESQVSTALNNLGYVFDNLGNTKEALKFYHGALNISERINDQDNIATQLNNIASIISSNGNITEALSYYEKALKISEQRKDSTGIALFLVNIGVMYSNLKQADKAIHHYQHGLQIAEKIEDKGRIAHALSRIGSHYYRLGKFSEADANFKYALQISEELKDYESAADILTYMSEMLIYQKKWKEALVFARKSLDIANALGYPALIQNASKNLSIIYEAQGDGMKALSMHRLYVRMRDSVVNAENQKALVRSQLEAEYARKAAADSIVFAKERQINEAQIEKGLAQLKAKRNQQYILYGGLTLSLLFFGIVFNRFRVTKAQKKIIESQKTVVEEKNKEITDSITYAKRIQNAILPHNALIAKHLPNSFILYKPKDIIAGDFYWLCEENNSVLFAVADCTGHGVPGAIVSMVCNSSLNQAVREFHLSEPGKVLDKTRKIVIEEFEKSLEDVKDGMDVSLVHISKKQDHFEIRWSGANNPLWYIQDNELKEIKAHKQPIGQTDLPAPFPTHELKLVSGDIIYLFSDGYADQFGGPKNKKFKYRQLKELLFRHRDLPMKAQKEILETEFEKWRGKNEQLDDVTIAAIRL